MDLPITSTLAVAESNSTPWYATSLTAAFIFRRSTRTGPDQSTPMRSVPAAFSSGSPLMTRVGGSSTSSGAMDRAMFSMAFTGSVLWMSTLISPFTPITLPEKLPPWCRMSRSVT